MKSKICTQCRLKLSLEMFHKSAKAKDGLAPYCKACKKKTDKVQYAQRSSTQRSAYRNQEQKRKREVAKRVFIYLQAHPCVDCGEKDPVVLDFDHVRDSKTDNISALISKWSWEHLLTEIKKCDVRCANCHRRVTAKRAKYQRHQLTHAAKD